MDSDLSAAPKTCGASRQQQARHPANPLAQARARAFSGPGLIVA